MKDAQLDARNLYTAAIFSKAQAGGGLPPAENL